MAVGHQPLSCSPSSPLEEGEFVPQKVSTCKVSGMVTGQSHSQQGHPLPKLDNQPQKPSYVSILQAQEQISRAVSIAQGQNQSQPSSDPLTMVKYQDPTTSILKPISQHQGKPAVHFLVSEKEALVEKLNLVLIGKFTHGRPSLSNIKIFFQKFKLQGVINVSLADSKHIYIECSYLSDYYWIWLNLSMQIHGFDMRIFKWSADFSPSIESPLAPVWIRIVGMPLYLFDEMSLWQIASAVGKPIRIDTRNLNRSILSFARVCVELDISQQPTDTIWVCIKKENTDIIVERICLQVFYDVLPLYCTVCSHIGHGEEVCKRKMGKGPATLNVEPTSQKDHRTAPVVAATCSDPLQAVTTVWLPVKKNNTAAKLNSENRIGSINLLGGEASKALGISEVDLACVAYEQPTKTETANVFELNPLPRNEEEAAQTLQNNPAAKQIECTTVLEQSAVHDWQLVTGKRNNRNNKIQEVPVLGGNNEQPRVIDVAYSKVGQEDATDFSSSIAATICDCNSDLASSDACLQIGEDGETRALEKKSVATSFLDQVVVASSSGVGARNEHPGSSDGIKICVNSSLLTSVSAKLQGQISLDITEQNSQSLQPVSVALSEETRDEQVRGHPASMFGIVAANVDHDTKGNDAATKIDKNRPVGTTAASVIETVQTLQIRTAADQNASKIENGHSQQSLIDMGQTPSRSTAITLELKCTAEAELQQESVQIKRHIHQEHLHSSSRSSSADKMEKVDMKDNTVMQAENVNALQNDTVKMNTIEAHNKSKGLLGKGPILKARFTKFGKLKYCDELEMNKRHIATLKGRSRSQPPNKVVNQEYSDNDLPLVDQTLHFPGEEPKTWSQAIAENILVARRSVPPKGRMSSKLSSLETKCDHIDLFEARAQLWDQINYDSKQHLLGVAGTFRLQVATPPPSRHISPPSRSAPGQTTRRGRGRNRGRNMQGNGKRHF